MRTDKVKQVVVVSDPDPERFENRMNEALAGLTDPEVHLYENMPFTATIIYTVRRDMPEDVLELFEMVEGHHTCADCPHLVMPEDKRKKWGTCTAKGTPSRSDGRACERFYVHRHKVLMDAKDRFLQLPFSAD